MRKLIWTAAALALVACSTNSQPAPTAAYRPPPPPAYRAPAAPQPYAQAPRAAPSSGPYRWHTRIADAQNEARATGRLILVGSTKPSCGLCEKFKNQIVPSQAGQASAVTVGYMVDALTPESPQVWQMLRANLPSATLMPLVGIITPDLRWVTGFSGPTDQNKLLSALATARRMQPVALPATPRETDARTASISEPGIYRWTPLSEVVAAHEAWPEPEDALTGEPALAEDEAPIPEEEAVVAEVPEAAPSVPPAALWAPLPDTGTLRAAPRPVDPAELEGLPLKEPAKPAAEPKAASAPAPEVVEPLELKLTQPRQLPPAPRPARALSEAQRPTAPAPEAPFSQEPETLKPGWGEQALREALGMIEDGRFDAARDALARVSARMAETALAREAQRGTVALYHAVTISKAGAAEQPVLRERALRNFRSSMWSALFD